jgi:hypothetical protein
MTIVNTEYVGAVLFIFAAYLDRITQRERQEKEREREKKRRKPIKNRYDDDEIILFLRLILCLYISHFLIL